MLDFNIKMIIRKKIAQRCLIHARKKKKVIAKALQRLQRLFLPVLVLIPPP